MNTWTAPKTAEIPMMSVTAVEYKIFALLSYAANPQEGEDFDTNFMEWTTTNIAFNNAEHEVNEIKEHPMYNFVCGVYFMKFNINLDGYLTDTIQIAKDHEAA